MNIEDTDNKDDFETVSERELSLLITELDTKTFEELIEMRIRVLRVFSLSLIDYVIDKDYTRLFDMIVMMNNAITTEIDARIEHTRDDTPEYII